MKVLGIDPGSHRMGWGVIDGNSSKQRLIDSGCFEFKSGTESSVYLPKLYESLNKLFQKFDPDILGIETLLFQKNAKTAITVAQARGVVLLVAAQNHMKVIEIAPNTIKATVAGHGGADKKQVAYMVGLLLGIDTKKMLDDTADALAVAISALVTHKK